MIISWNSNISTAVKGSLNWFEKHKAPIRHRCEHYSKRDVLRQIPTILKQQYFHVDTI